MSRNENAELQDILAGRDLSREVTQALFGRLMDGELSDVVKSALLVGLAMKGEAASEIAGAASAMRKRVLTIPHTVAKVVDTCGTGGDGKGTFNISTAAALVAAAAGVPVAKHGNRSVSSKSGSADVLAELGVRIDLTPDEAGRCLHAVGIAFLFAPKLHPAMKEVMPVRRELGVRTIFNVLGPLTNPAGAQRQVVGVFAQHLVDTVADVLAELGSEHAFVVHGSDGLDEITLTGPTRIAEVRRGEVRTYEIGPGDLGLDVCQPADLAGGTPQENAEAMRRVLGGEEGPLLDITAANAGAAMVAGGLVMDLAEAVEAAREVILSGLAQAKLEELAAWS
ncbi:MAG: anthranilate phosphoribosyltransferase [Thermoanaerobaculia bacterium]|nr:anthranilate phosphoribosyltransferase [Thermoanaerobaculia bacterium]